MAQYKTHNPDIILLGLKDGTPLDEHRYHQQLQQFRHLTEWFCLPQEMLSRILNEFNQSTLPELYAYNGTSQTKRCEPTQVPTMDLKAEGLANTDPYIYACIKKYMNTSTKQAWPSNSTLTKISGLSAKTVIAAINRLEQAGYISVQREYGKSNVYTFNDYKKFEIFSYEFLDRTDLSPKEKAYFITVQPFMFKGDTTGTITFSTNTLAERISLSVNTLKKYEQILKEKNMMDLIPVKTDNSTGLPVYVRSYNFEQWSNLVAIKFVEHDERLNNHDYELQRLKDEVQFLKNELKKREIKDQAEAVQITL